MSRNIVRSVRRLSELQRYKPPKWAASLKDIPQHFVRLAQRNTPIHPWDLSQLPKGFSLFIKRDDLTGNTLSGNKVRKLDFLLADALYKNCDTIFTCGGLQSNHCRATAVASRQLGLSCFLFLRSPKQTTDIGCTGNLLLCKIVGSKMIVIPQLPYKHGLKQMMEKMAKEELNQKGSSVYQIEVGGSSYTGMFGYLTAFQELIEQNVLENFDDIVVTAGTGGTAAGIAIGNYLTGSKLKCHAVSVADNTAYAYSKINEDLQAGGLDVQAEEIIDIIDGYQGRGYGLSTQHELESILEISRTTGVMMDPVYNIKAVRGMLTEMKCNPTRFRGQRILYIHTGGVFDLYDGRIDTLLASSSSAAENAQQVASWGDIDDPMPFFDY
ncbi:putative D-cysteine desulfhydrase 1 [Acropora cervicornis]|uniref:D-cysteine desulfhydrase 1 n=1 Tax=Acropora cervicornis TaxID=6130 RepID=A0AAD9VA84_ACRCE|nr:putative D-cysteine desulfhydrase 1 [Acropora cervicornis]